MTDTMETSASGETMERLSSASFSERVKVAMAHLSEIDEGLRRAIETVGPCLLEPNPGAFEALVDAIISQQISVKAADAIMGRVRAGLGGGAITPEMLAALQDEELRGFGLSPQKVRYMRNLVEHIMSGALDIERLGELDDEEVVRQLTAVKGIGRWTAEMCLIFTLGRLDVLPVDDLGLMDGVRGVYGLEARPTRKELLARGEAWRPYRTIATWYLWAMRRIEMKYEKERTRIVSL